MCYLLTKLDTRTQKYQTYFHANFEVVMPWINVLIVLVENITLTWNFNFEGRVYVILWWIGKVTNNSTKDYE